MPSPLNPALAWLHGSCPSFIFCSAQRSSSSSSTSGANKRRPRLPSLPPACTFRPRLTNALVPRLTGTLRTSPMPPLALVAFLAAPSEWAIIGACLGLAAAVFLFIFYIQPDASDLAPHRTKLDQLLERRDTIYDNIRDLKFENRAGKYSEGDYETMKNSMETEAAMVLAEIDQVTEAGVKRPRGSRTATERGAR